MTELGLLAWNSDFRGRKRSMLLLKPGDSLNGDRGLGSQSHAAPERASGPNSPPPILQRRKLRPRGEGTFSEPPDPQVPTPCPGGILGARRIRDPGRGMVSASQDGQGPTGPHKTSGR